MKETEMSDDNYLWWMIRTTKTRWWHDSADPGELRRALHRGAVGVTTNPMLANLALRGNQDLWRQQIEAVFAEGLDPERRAEEFMRIVISHTAEHLLPEYEQSSGMSGFVCAQVNPARAGDREAMMAMARRFHAWAPNITVKLPATWAGLDVLEACAAEGITTTATVSFTVPQVVVIAERYRAGIRRAKETGTTPGKCFAVIMIGRLDDFLRDVARDNRTGIQEADIQQAGLAVTKRAYAIYRERGYEATLIVAAMRGDYHMTELAGADLIMSIAPPYQESLVSSDLPREERIEREIGKETLDRLSGLPEFRRAYEPDGMKPEEFIAYGVTQKTLSQFWEMGWSQLERFHL